MTDDTRENTSRIGALPASPRTRSIMTLGTSLLCLAFAAALLYAAFCAFTWFKFALFDYGIYTNMIWNSSRGRMFVVLTTRSYLKTHLSFSLALLGPLYYVWDHPFLLAIVQWLMLTGGAAGLVLAAIRHKVPGHLTAAITLLYMAYPFTQSVLLCEFHGVAGYLLLLPWLYYCLSFRPNLAWAPLFLILGLREEAFLLIVPILAYFAARHRSRAVWAMLAVSIVYGLLAVLYLFPAVVGRSLLERRADCIPDGSILGIFGTRDVVLSKIKALAWVALPAVFFLRRGWCAVLVFLSAPVLTVLLSSFEKQYALRLHYPAAVMACLGVALLEAAAKGENRQPRPSPAASTILACILLLVTLGAHLYQGYLPLGGKSKIVYRRPNRQGLEAMRAARKLPRDGILMAPDRLMPFCANRADITKWTYLARPERPRDLIFAGLVDVFGRKHRVFRELIASGDFGLKYVDSSYVLLVKGADTSANAEMLAALDAGSHTVRFYTTLRHGGDNVSHSDGTTLRHWKGKGRDGPLTIAHGLAVKLPPGNYEAVFHLRTGNPGANPGVLSIHPHNKHDPLARTDIQPPPGPSAEFQTQRLLFKLEEEMHVEPRVTAGDTELWLDRAEFRQAGSDR